MHRQCVSYAVVTNRVALPCESFPTHLLATVDQGLAVVVQNTPGPLMAASRQLVGYSLLSRKLLRAELDQCIVVLLAQVVALTPSHVWAVPAVSCAVTGLGDGKSSQSRFKTWLGTSKATPSLTSAHCVLLRSVAQPLPFVRHTSRSSDSPKLRRTKRRSDGDVFWSLPVTKKCCLWKLP